MIRVLVVDDDFMVARIHRGFVERVPGFTVVGVSSTGSQALDAVRTSRPDLVLLDIHLPDVNGLALLPRLREVHPDLDAIVISAAREADTVRQALRGGIVHYLLKPFSHEDLRESLLHYERSYRRLDARGHRRAAGRQPGLPASGRHGDRRPAAQEAQPRDRRPHRAHAAGGGP